MDVFSIQGTLPSADVLSLSLKFAIIEAGKVLPRSQMSTNFLILSYHVYNGESTSCNIGEERSPFYNARTS